MLGSLIEKQISTPDYYPLTLNALTNACNQLSNREPVVSYDEQSIVQAIDGLREKRLATLFRGAESRVSKYRHSLGDVLPLTPAEIAVLCVLMLRGPQTLGELRTRTERLFTFDDLAEVEAALTALATHEPPLVAKLPRQPGAKESRFAHLLSGPVDAASIAPPPVSASTAPAAPAASGLAAPGPDRLTQFEQELAALRLELEEVKRQLTEFRKQFE